MMVELNDICEIINGGAWKQSEYSPKGIGVIKVSNLKSSGIEGDISFLPEESLVKYQKHELEPHDLLVTTVGSHAQLTESAAGRGFILPERYSGYLLNQNVVCIRPKDEKLINKRYLGYLGISHEFRHFIQAQGRGAANQMRIAISGIKNFKFDLPPLPIQKKIAAILSTYDELIENNRRRIQLLEEAAQNIYREWFVHLRFPGHEQTPIDEETGLPVGWERKVLKDVLTLNYGKSLRKDKRNNNGDIPVFGSSGVVGFHDEALVKNEGIILGRKGNVGTVFYSPVAFYPIDTVYFVTSGIPIYFMYHFLKNQVWVSSDAAVPGLNRNYVYSKAIVLPQSILIDDYQNISSSFFEQIGCLKTQNQKLQEARDILLPRLMNQTIEVT